MQKLQKIIPFLYLLFVLFILLFTSESAATTNHGVIIPFIHTKPIYPLLLGSLFFAFLTLIISKPIRFDGISIILLIRILLCFIPMLYKGMNAYFFGNFGSSFIPFFFYFIFSNSHIKKDHLNKIFIVTGLIIFAQVVLAYYLIVTKQYSSYTDLFYKDYMVIPLAASNMISAMILPLLIVGNKTIKNKVLNLLYCLALSIAILLTKSRAGIVLVLLYFLYIIIFDKKRAEKDIVFSFFAGLLLLITLVVLNSSYGFADRFVSLFRGYGSGNSFDSFSSGRLTLYDEVFKLSLDYPLFGNGIDYEQLGFRRAHNLFLGIFYENGIIGIIVLFVFGFIFFKNIFINIKDRYTRAFLVAMVFVLMNSMVEEIIFTSFIDLFLLSYYSNITQRRNYELQRQGVVSYRWDRFFWEHDCK